MVCRTRSTKLVEYVSALRHQRQFWPVHVRTVAITKAGEPRVAMFLHNVPAHYSCTVLPLKLQDARIVCTVLVLYCCCKILLQLHCTVELDAILGPASVHFKGPTSL